MRYKQLTYEYVFRVSKQSNRYSRGVIRDTFINRDPAVCFDRELADVPSEGQPDAETNSLKYQLVVSAPSRVKRLPRVDVVTVDQRENETKHVLSPYKHLVGCGALLIQI